MMLDVTKASVTLAAAWLANASQVVTIKQLQKKFFLLSK
jgi:hypothetical protein